MVARPPTCSVTGTAITQPRNLGVPRKLCKAVPDFFLRQTSTRPALAFCKEPKSPSTNLSCATSYLHWIPYSLGCLTITVPDRSSLSPSSFLGCSVSPRTKLHLELFAEAELRPSARQSNRVSSREDSAAFSSADGGSRSPTVSPGQEDGGIGKEIRAQDPQQRDRILRHGRKVSSRMVSMDTIPWLPSCLDDSYSNSYHPTM
jgi:hypothetical protein